MAFNILASHQINNSSYNTGTPTSRTHTVSGSFLAGDIAIILSMSNSGGRSYQASYNWGFPSDYTPVIYKGGAGNYIAYGYKVFTAPSSGYSVTFTTDYNSFLAVVRGYKIKEEWTGTLPQTRDFATGDVLLLPGGGQHAGFTAFGHGYSTQYDYAGAYREFTTTTTGFSVPNVTQYSSGVSEKSFMSLTTQAAPNAPTGVTVTNSPVPSGGSANVSWTFSDSNTGDTQSKYQIRWRKKD